MKKRNLKNKILTGLLALSMVVGLTLPSYVAEAAEEAKYVALGDSIPAGVASTTSFVSIIDGREGIAATNKGFSGLTSVEMKTAMGMEHYDADIIDADFITLTIGGNDLMATFYQLVATTYNASAPVDIDATDVPRILAAGSAADPAKYNATLTAVLTVVGGGYSGATELAFEDASAAVATNVQEMITYIQSKNNTAEIYVTNQYNPYKGIAIELFPGMGVDVGAFFDAGVKDLNGNLSGLTNCTVVDVYSEFENKNTTPGSVTNATIIPTINLDFHPNAAGHGIYEQALSMINVDSINHLESVTQSDITYGTEVEPVISYGSETQNGGDITYMYKAQGQADTTYSAEKPKNVGLYTVKATSAANGQVLEKSVTADFEIAAKAITPTVATIEDQYYTGSQITPWVEVTDGATPLMYGTDYDLTFGSNVDVSTGGSVTVTLKGNYSGSATVAFNIIEEAIVEGQNQAINKGDKITVKSNGYFGAYIETRVDGKAVDSTDLTVEEGSIIVTLSGNYTNTLSVGTHELEIVTELGSAKTTFTIQEPAAPAVKEGTTPDTSDATSVHGYLLVMILAVIGMSGVVIIRKKNV